VALGAAAQASRVTLAGALYICSLSSQTVVYKGLLTPWQFPQFYEDLRDPAFATTFAVFHQRYSNETRSFLALGATVPLRERTTAKSTRSFPTGDGLWAKERRDSRESSLLDLGSGCSRNNTSADSASL